MLGAVFRGTLKVVASLLLLLLVLGLLLAVHVWSAARGSLPALEGEVALAGLSAPVTVERDASGNAVITGATRTDVAAALGFLHGQERFFQMDLLRRTAAGELGELLGAPGLALDRLVRPHRFRARARAILAQMSPEERALVEAYADGVNRGRETLARRPWEHALLFTPPRPWFPEDTVLVVFAMYLNLQPATPVRELDRARATLRGGPALADFLYPDGSPNDAALDGSMMPEPPMPRALEPLDPQAPLPAAAGEPAPAPAEEPVAGSNNWAVAGALTATGAALVANDMHLGTRLPNTWYRARLIVRPQDGGEGERLDIVGATLPGTPMMVVGSNGRIAWGFTNSYIDTADAVIVEPAGSDDLYATPAGPQPFRRHAERICGRFRCETLEVR
jgi:penicillin amidase